MTQSGSDRDGCTSGTPRVTFTVVSSKVHWTGNEPEEVGERVVGGLRDRQRETLCRSKSLN